MKITALVAVCGEEILQIARQFISMFLQDSCKMEGCGLTLPRHQKTLKLSAELIDFGQWNYNKPHAAEFILTSGRYVGESFKTAWKRRSQTWLYISVFHFYPPLSSFAICHRSWRYCQRLIRCMHYLEEYAFTPLSPSRHYLKYARAQTKDNSKEGLHLFPCRQISKRYFPVVRLRIPLLLAQLLEGSV